MELCSWTELIVWALITSTPLIYIGVKFYNSVD
jgi:hypothetical protein